MGKVSKRRGDRPHDTEHSSEGSCKKKSGGGASRPRSKAKNGAARVPPVENDNEDGPSVLSRMTRMTPIMIAVVAILWWGAYGALLRYYAIPAPTKPVSWIPIPDDMAVRGNETRLTVMWEESVVAEEVLKQHEEECQSELTKGLLIYRVYRRERRDAEGEAPETSWVEIVGSPTSHLGIRDEEKGRKKHKSSALHYKCMAQFGTCHSEWNEQWIRIGKTNFSKPTSSRAPQAPVGISIEDISTIKGEEKLMLRWRPPPGEDVLGLGPVQGYTVWYHHYKTKRRVMLLKTQHYMLQHVHDVSELGHGKHCYSFKAISWGDIGTSAPAQKCIVIREWLWEVNERVRQENMERAKAEGEIEEQVRKDQRLLQQEIQ